MIIPKIYTDDHGHTYFGEVEIEQHPGRSALRVAAKSQDIEYWQVHKADPGHTVDFEPTGEPTVLAIMSGQLRITVSNGEVQNFCRGDLVFLQDLEGQGHAREYIGFEPCEMVAIVLPGEGKFK